MAPEYVLGMAHQAMQVAMMVDTSVLLMSLVVGPFVAVFQVATQPNEQTLSFTSKLLAVAVATVLAGPWIVAVIVDHMRGALTDIPNYVS